MNINYNMMMFKWVTKVAYLHLKHYLKLTIYSNIGELFQPILTYFWREIPKKSQTKVETSRAFSFMWCGET